jgi:hypothetical protein
MWFSEPDLFPKRGSPTTERVGTKKLQRVIMLKLNKLFIVAVKHNISAFSYYILLLCLMATINNLFTL